MCVVCVSGVPWGTYGVAVFPSIRPSQAQLFFESETTLPTPEECVDNQRTHAKFSSPSSARLAHNLTTAEAASDNLTCHSSPWRAS